MHQSAYEYALEYGHGGDLLRRPDTLEIDRRLLEVGSLVVPGNTWNLRDAFASREYVGVDAQPGPGVDLVWDVTRVAPPELGRRLPLILCLEMLEHCRRPWIAVENMIDLLAPAGRIVLTTRGFESGHMPVHAYPDDYYRFSLDAVLELVAAAGRPTRIVDARQDPEMPGVFVTAELED